MARANEVRHVGLDQRVEPESLQLLGRLVLAEEGERRRIAREMHDEFGQQLTALRLQTVQLKAECSEHAGLRSQVEALEAIAIQLDQGLDLLICELRPAALDDFGLRAALANYVQNWAAHFGIPAELQTSGLEKDRLTAEVETTLYRIAQEALANVAKHAQAEKVDVILERRADQVLLIVEDDGVGFETRKARVTGRGLGLVGIEERAALVAATAQVESAPGRGTTILVRVPLATPAVRRAGG